jgi:predicted esterase
MTFVLPTAPTIPVGLNNGMKMPAWYDMPSLSLEDRKVERLTYFGDSVEYLKELIAACRGARPVIVGGFSQGGVVALSAVFSDLTIKVDGVFALSTYAVTDAVEAQKDTPLFMAHGERDEMVPFQFGKQCFEMVKSTGKLTDSVFQAYPHLGHEVDYDEIMTVAEFIKAKGAGNSKM